MACFMLKIVALLLFSLSYVRALAGDTQCIKSMCVTAVVNDTNTVTYSIKVNKANIGWAGIAFGASMADTPLVMLFKNSSGLVTLSQRKSPQHNLPPVDSNPPFIATPYQALTSFTTAESVMSFTVPAPSSTKQTIGVVYAMDPPNSNDEPQFHDENGVVLLDLTKSSAGSEEIANPDDIPLSTNERILLAHGVIMGIVFMLVLPLGSLLARFARTYTNTWFFGHWILQFAVAGPLFLVAWFLAVYEVGAVGKTHFTTTHRKWGLALFFLYLLQISLGAIIHFIKPKRAARRPIQNYFHAFLGLGIIATAFYQIYTGMFGAWPAVTGRLTPNSYYLFWAVWVILLPVAYSLGLALLPRQFTQERKSRESKMVPLQAVYRPDTYRDRDRFGQDKGGLP